MPRTRNKFRPIHYRVPNDYASQAVAWLNSENDADREDIERELKAAGWDIFYVPSTRTVKMVYVGTVQS